MKDFAIQNGKYKAITFLLGEESEFYNGMKIKPENYSHKGNVMVSNDKYIFN